MRTVSFRKCNPKDPWGEGYIYLHLVDLDGVGKHIVRPMDPMGVWGDVLGAAPFEDSSDRQD